jgi:spore cortex formation protein SpoVR/YcgB (stage V sporulation)
MKVSLHTPKGQVLMWHRRNQGFTKGRLGLDTPPANYVITKRHDMLATEVLIGMPLHYRHWSVGKRYLMQASQPRALEQLAYELVINSDPAYIYHQEDNDRPLDAMICPHVQGHLYFFKHNSLFADTKPAQLMDRLRDARDLIESYRRNPAIGEEKVNEALEAAHALSHHVGGIRRAQEGVSDAEERARLETRLDDLKWQIPRENSAFKKKGLVEEQQKIREQLGRKPLTRSDDLMGFLIDKDNNPNMLDYVRNIFQIVWEDNRYFLPQGWTKSMNEGFATFIHLMALKQPEYVRSSLKYAPRFAQLSAMFERTYSGAYFIPYALGTRVFQDIYRKSRGDEPEVEWTLDKLAHDPEPAQGEEYFLFPTGEKEVVRVKIPDIHKVKEVVRDYDDANFFRTFLTNELFAEMNRTQLSRIKDWMMRINIMLPAHGFSEQLVVNPLPDKLEDLMNVIEMWGTECVNCEQARKSLGTPLFPAAMEVLKDVGTAMQVMAAFEQNKDMAKRMIIFRNVPYLHQPKIWVVDASDGVLTLVHDYDRIFGKLQPQEAQDVLKYVKNNWGSGNKVQLKTMRRKPRAKKEDPAHEFTYVCDEKGETSGSFT